MDGIASLESVSVLLALVVPGFIALSVRSQFVTGMAPLDTRERFLSFVAISIVYGSLVLRFIGPDQILRSTLVFLAVLFVGPVVLGLILGVNIQKDIFRSILRRLGLFTVHPVPTAWDWKFAGSVEEQWVLATLKDGREYAGLFGKESFASSNTDERDLYIQWIYDRDEDGNWTSSGPKGVLITASEISSVEFLPFASEEGGNA